jgi:hypothetical protein
MKSILMDAKDETSTSKGVTKMKNVWILIMLTPITLLSIVGLVASYIYYQGTSERALER